MRGGGRTSSQLPWASSPAGFTALARVLARARHPGVTARPPRKGRGRFHPMHMRPNLEARPPMHASAVVRRSPGGLTVSSCATPACAYVRAHICPFLVLLAFRANLVYQACPPPSSFVLMACKPSRPVSFWRPHKFSTGRGHRVTRGRQAVESCEVAPRPAGGRNPKASTRGREHSQEARQVARRRNCSSAATSRGGQWRWSRTNAASPNRRSNSVAISNCGGGGARLVS